jgi:membrane-associated phospholipid phosphatase
MRNNRPLRGQLAEFDTRFATFTKVAQNPGRLRTLAVILAHSGDSWFLLLGAGILWLAGSAYWKYRAEVMAVGIIITALVVLAIKFLVRRSRPQGEWGQIYRRTDPHSFPSGHATRAMMLATLGLGLGPTWFGLVFLAWSPLVSMARVGLGIHYLSDVVAGLALGVLMGLLVLSGFR